MTTKITTEVIGSNTITAENMAVDSVGSDELQNDSVQESHYANVSIPNAAYKLLSVDTPQLAANAVEAEKIGDDAILERHYSNQSIPNTAYKLLSVGTPQLADASVTLVKMANASVGNSQLIDDAVTRPKLADNVIGTAEIENYKVTPSKHEKGIKGDIYIATETDGSFTRVPVGTESSVLAVKSGLPTWTDNVLPTGTMLDYCGNYPPTGWVLANGRTIGSAASAADEAADDLEDLFVLLWDNSDNDELTVSGGRGSTAAADWSANKTIELPDARGRTTVARSALGSSESGRLNSVSAGGDTMFADGGVDTVTLTQSQIPEHYHFSFVRNTTYGNDVSEFGECTANDTAHHYALGGNKSYSIRPSNVKPLGANVSQTSKVGSSGSHDNMPPFLVTTKIIKK